MPPLMLYVGTHARAHRADPADTAFGIYAFEADRMGHARPAGLAHTPQPGWLAAHPDGRTLYAVNEVRTLDGAPGASIAAFAIDEASGALRPLNTQPVPPMPCHCAVDATGRFLLTATFGGGSVHLHPIEADGAIGAEADAHHHQGASVHPRRQTAPHAHAVAIDPANRFVMVPDLGTDRVMVYELDSVAGRLRPRPDRTVALPPGSGPRHLVFARDGRTAYLVNEMTAALTVFACDPAGGALAAIQTVDLLPEGFAGLRSGAAIALDPSGRFLYCTTRSHGSSGMPAAPGLDLLVWFAVEADGRLTPGGHTPSGGAIPRSFAITPDGGHLLVGHQCSGTITRFRLDPENGTPVPHGPPIATPVPVCLLFAGG